ncbi:MAG TPA: type II restriction endonuclease [Allosphingosinicella sp.]|jgi:hypothetical protein
MALGDVSQWIAEHTREDVVWYVKRLSGNDTLANGSHQGGPYVPKPVLFAVFPELRGITERNADKRFPLYLDSHPDVREVRAVWYNNKLRSGTRNEGRITGFGGRASPLLDAESTGAIAIFAFSHQEGSTASDCHAWISRNEVEEDLIEAHTGPVEPGAWITMRGGRLPALALEDRPKPRVSCWLEPEEVPAEWFSAFPSEGAIIQKALDLRSVHGMTPDERLIARRRCEQEIARSVEQAIELPKLQRGVGDLEFFLSEAQMILARRRALSRLSLHLHVKRILVEEGFQEGRDFDETPPAGLMSRPDFLFPHAQAHNDTTLAPTALRALTVMLTCRDRWRQILDQGAGSRMKHLLTLQEGVSENQFEEMRQANVLLVVPEALRESYPPIVRPQLLSLESFIADVRLAA